MTLLYCDLRVRREGYDMTTLAGEMGVAPGAKTVRYYELPDTESTDTERKEDR